jgi:hypothetical protein
MNRICLHGDTDEMTVALYRAEDQVAMLQRLAYLAADSEEPLSPMALNGIAHICDDIIDTLAHVSDSLNRIVK